MNEHENHLIGVFASSCLNNHLTSTDLIKRHIDYIFETGEDQVDIAIRLFKFVLPEWNKIKYVEGFIHVGKEMNSYIFNKFHEFDKENHPEVMRAGLWLNKGFGTDEKLSPWEVSFKGVTVNYEE